MVYTEDNILRIAKRNHNTKRKYLLVNPLQGKHLPVDPRKSLSMMNTFGKILASKYPTAKLIIGFAETATAIGAAIAANFDNAVYITTTREEVVSDSIVSFKEEHSHAVDQILVTDNFNEYLANTDTVILIDDELSTGKTICNIVDILKKNFPELNNKTIVAASIINRMSAENIVNMEKAGIKFESLVKIENTDYTSMVDSWDIADPSRPESISIDKTRYTVIDKRGAIPDVRYGINANEYNAIVTHENAKTIDTMDDVSGGVHGKVLVIGTEEFMYPAIKLAQQLADSKNLEVYTQSTTRSPIGVISGKICPMSYPIYKGNRIFSFYDMNRKTYIYDFESYDSVIVVTDSKVDYNIIDHAIYDIALLANCDTLYLVRY